MGGRGASSGTSVKGKPYGSEYKTVLTDGNIKFVKPASGNTTAPIETMTKGRIYVTIDREDKPKFITYFDTENKRTKQIDLDFPHRGLSPHTHHGYIHNENDGATGATHLTTEEKKMVERVRRIWYNRHSK